jgi:nicotinamide-nucleotide amidase
MPAPLRVELLCIGSELLKGRITNTNATTIAQDLLSAGAQLQWVTTVGDDLTDIVAVIHHALTRVDLLILTGGLGPTPDDLTIEALARVWDEPLTERPEALLHLQEWFKTRNRPMSPSNLKQTLFPPSATLIPNPSGTAFGVSLARDGKQVWAFPGVPSELRLMWDTWAVTRLQTLSAMTIKSVLLRYAGIGESVLAERFAALLASENPTVAPYAGNGEVHLLVTAQGDDPQAVEAMLAGAIAPLTAIPEYFGRDDQTLPHVVGHTLATQGLTLAVAESCTGGLLASRLTDVPGASQWLMGGIVAYTETQKHQLLSVDNTALAHGVVSEAVAIAMAQGVKALLGTTYGIGVTGYASPGIGVPPEDVGLVWMAIDGPVGPTAFCQRFGTGMQREVLKYRATQVVLDHLRRLPLL